MRFLLSLIISSFFFIAPFQSNAGEISGKKLTVNTDTKIRGTEITDYSIIDGNAEAILLTNRNRSSLSQLRFQTYTNFIDQVVFNTWINFLPGKENIIQPYSYCKPIGLKLVFPQHYFW